MYVECDKYDSSSAYATLYACINDIIEWLSSNFLLLNDKKTELIEYNSNGLNQNNHLVIGNTVIDTQPCVTNLGSGCWPCDLMPCSSHVQIRISSLALYYI